MAAGPGSDTIFALASGQGRSAIAVVRISGSAAGGALRALLEGELPQPRRLSLRRLREPGTGAVIDQALIAWLPGPATFTGEDQAELHIHGGLAVKAAVLAALSGQGFCRPAEPGEFTRRAFLNGRLDLTEVEGLADLIAADTEAQRRQALRQLEGVLSVRVEDWRERLVRALALCEAELDFADEEDVPVGASRAVLGEAAAIREEIRQALLGATRGERLRDGFVVVIAGPPNAGKSTLLNALAGRDVAIVSPIPGTTRDAIEVRCDIGGLPVTFVDTAGLRESDDPVEREGVARANRRITDADLVVWLRPVDAPGSSPDLDGRRVREVWTKADLGLGSPTSADALSVSATTGAGLQELLAAVQGDAERGLGTGHDALVTRERHRLVLTEVVACLDRAVLAGQACRVELFAEDLRLALRALGRMTGRVDVEEVLDRIFSTFCIGK